MGGSDVVGIVFLEISRVTDLPPERNVTRTSFDMDPFVVASLGKKTYRTRVVRHNLNPVFDERMIFQVLPHEQAYSISFSVVDRDTLSGNDFVGTASVTLQHVISTAPEADPETGLYSMREPPDPDALPLQPNRSRFRLPGSRSSSSSSLNRLGTKPALRSRKSTSSLLNQAMTPPDQVPAPTGVPDNGPSPTSPRPVETSDSADPEGDPELKQYVLPISLKNKERWESKHSPELYIRAKYVPYPALRQQFWRALVKQYDADESGRMSKVELSTMLDTLGSTLKDSTIDGFFDRFAPGKDPNGVDLTPDQVVICLEDQLEKASRKRSMAETVKDHLPHLHPAEVDDRGHGQDQDRTGGASPNGQAEPAGGDDDRAGTAASPDHNREGSEIPPFDELMDDRGEEHVVKIQECPICHKPRLRKKSDADIITHIATCASHDWRQVNNLVMAEFVTSSQAQRKWYSKVITKISYGGYKLGANSANILVQDRITGQINEERMSVYVRLGIRLLYKGLKSREMEKKRSTSSSPCIQPSSSTSVLPFPFWLSPTDSFFVNSCLKQNSPQAAQVAQHQAGPQVRRPGLGPRDSGLHRLPQARYLGCPLTAARVQDVQRVLLPPAEARGAAVLGPRRSQGHRLAGGLPVRCLQPRRRRDGHLGQGPRVLGRASARKRLPG